MEIQNLNTRKFLKETPAGEIPVDWVSAALSDISEISDSKITPEPSPNRIFITRGGEIHNSKPDKIRSLSITVKKGFSLPWIEACLASEGKPLKYTKKCLENYHIPLPPPPEIGSAAKTLKTLESLIPENLKKLTENKQVLSEYTAEINEFRSEEIPYQRSSGKKLVLREAESYIRLEEYIRSILERLQSKGRGAGSRAPAPKASE